MDAMFAMKSLAMKFPLFRLSLVLALLVLLSSCVNRADLGGRGYYSAPMVKDNKPSIWLSDHSRVRKFRAQYLRTRTVPDAL